MSQMLEVKVPDIGDYSDVPVIDVLVKVGDTVKVDDGLLTLESDKATMDVPSSVAGIVKEIRVGLGDKVSEGSVVVIVEAAGAAAAAPAPTAQAPVVPPSPEFQAEPSAAPAAVSAASALSPDALASGGTFEVRVPDIGDYDDVPVIDLLVKVGDTVKMDDGLVTLESDKATMDVPSSVTGVVKEIKVKLGDRVSEGTLIALIEATGGNVRPAPAASAPAPTAAPAAPAAAPAAAVPAAAPASAAAAAPAPGLALGARTHASPSVRLFARELGVDLTKVPATGPKGRILREDIAAFVKGALKAGPAPAAAGASLGGGLDLLQIGRAHV